MTTITRPILDRPKTKIDLRYTNKTANWLLASAFILLGFSFAAGLLPGITNPAKNALNNVWGEITTPLFMVMIMMILVVERFKPVDNRPLLKDPNVIQDAIYMLIITPITIALTATIVASQAGTIDKHFALIRVNTSSWPIWLTFITGLLIFDLVQYGAHLLVHKQKYLWRVHEFHHSQEKFNIFIPGRNHPIEIVLKQLLMLVPVFLIGANVIHSAQALIVFGLLDSWWTRIQHCNARINLGPLKHIMVTPQSHRVHHGATKNYWNSNYGHIFSFWDRIFGTRHDEVDVYPPTGISNPKYPLPESFKPSELYTTYCAQMAWPFRRNHR